MPGEVGAHHHKLSDHPEPSNDGQEARPDIFSLVAQESLMDGFHPAFKHAVKVISFRFPARLGWLYQNADELYLTLESILQYFSLKKNEASFSEYFYGLKRVSTSKPWTRCIWLVNLLSITLLPYIRRKLSTHYSDLCLQNADGKLNGQDHQTKLKKIFISIYPYIHAVWSGVVLSYLLRFLFGQSAVHSPLLHMCGAKLLFADPDEPMAGEEMSWSQAFTIPGMKSKLAFVWDKLSSLVPQLMLKLFSTAVFFLQFLQTYTTYQQGQGEDNSLSAASSIPPPKKPESQTVDTLCPICMKERTNSTALAVSGFVFCYPCVYKYVSQHATCPVTGFPAKISHLIRLYLPNS